MKRSVKRSSRLGRETYAGLNVARKKGSPTLNRSALRGKSKGGSGVNAGEGDGPAGKEKRWSCDEGAFKRNRGGSYVGTRKKENCEGAGAGILEVVCPGRKSRRKRYTKCKGT